MEKNRLAPEEERIIVGKGTEKPFSGEYDQHFRKGIYVCRRCGAPLYRSDDKFDSGCGWPSFDDEIKGAVGRVPDPDGARTEIQCARCRGHLGHVFSGEKLTEKDVRHCVNSLSMRFIPDEEMDKRFRSIVLGGGCFWCTEAIYRLVKGVLKVTPGYAGGRTGNPSYKDVCSGETGHAEVIEVVYGPETVPLEKILGIFFKSHDPTSLNRQGNDVGTQYRSIILYDSDEQKKAVERFIARISADYEKKIVTEVKRLERFYPAEDYHKDYFGRNPDEAYCRLVIAPKVEKMKKGI